MSVHIYPSPEALAGAAADHIAGYLAEATRPSSLGLAGGSTPRETYRRLADLRVDWSGVTMWLGDERWVPHDHPDSNTRMAREALADRVVAPLVAPETAFGEPGEAAASYSAVLSDIFCEGRPDLVLLGMGDDGHTASLFPDTAALETSSAGSMYLANWVGQKGIWRLTASMPLLWSARELMFLIQGEGKAGVLAQIIDDELPYPAQRVAAGAESVRWLVDEAAASQLR